MEVIMFYTNTEDQLLALYNINNHNCGYKLYDAIKDKNVQLVNAIINAYPPNYVFIKSDAENDREVNPIPFQRAIILAASNFAIFKAMCETYGMQISYDDLKESFIEATRLDNKAVVDYLTKEYPRAAADAAREASQYAFYTPTANNLFFSEPACNSFPIETDFKPKTKKTTLAKNFEEDPFDEFDSFNGLSSFKTPILCDQYPSFEQNTNSSESDDDISGITYMLMQSTLNTNESDSENEESNVSKKLKFL